MICPHLLISTQPKFLCRCTSVPGAPELNTGDINQYCATDEYNHCPNYQTKVKGVRQEIFREVYRAVG